MAAIRTFFNHRLPKDRDDARHEWLDIVEARHSLWTDISSPKKELVRSFLNALNLEIVKRIRPSSAFDFSSASIGNLFLTGYIPSQLPLVVNAYFGKGPVYSVGALRAPYIFSAAYVAFLRMSPSYLLSIRISHITYLPPSQTAQSSQGRILSLIQVSQRRYTKLLTKS